MSIIIGADMVATKQNENLFCEGNIEKLVGREITEVFSHADFRIINCEIPLTDGESPIAKSGPCLRAASNTVTSYRKLGIDLVTLANNHILDQGELGLQSTIKTLTENKIAYVGVGDCLENAKNAFITTVCGRSIAIYACAEHEFSIATKTTPGANPFDPYESFDEVEKLSKSNDYVIVLYHGGREHYRYPSPWLQKTCRKFVDKGANLVVCQHSHCIGCMEEYKGATVIYGQGNFLFDDSEIECWQTGLLISIDVEKGYKISCIPLRKNGAFTGLAKEKDAETILNGFNTRSKEILNDGFIEEKYKEIANQELSYYLQVLSGNKNGLISRALNKLTHKRWRSFYYSKIYNKRRLLSIKNVIQCEAHREIVLKGLDK